MKNWDVAEFGSDVLAIAMAPRTFFSPFVDSGDRRVRRAGFMPSVNPALNHEVRHHLWMSVPS
jgi:hypothetical protein